MIEQLTPNLTFSAIIRWTGKARRLGNNREKAFAKLLNKAITVISINLMPSSCLHKLSVALWRDRRFQAASVVGGLKTLNCLAGIFHGNFPVDQFRLAGLDTIDAGVDLFIPIFV